MHKIFIKMKKIVAVAFIASLAVVSCSKKTDNLNQDSNSMLDEPNKAVSIDSSYVPGTEGESARLDSAKAKVEIKTNVEPAKPADSTKTK